MSLMILRNSNKSALSTWQSLFWESIYAIECASCSEWSLTYWSVYPRYSKTCLSCSNVMVWVSENLFRASLYLRRNLLKRRWSFLGMETLICYDERLNFRLNLSFNEFCFIDWQIVYWLADSLLIVIWPSVNTIDELRTLIYDQNKKPIKSNSFDFLL